MVASGLKTAANLKTPEERTALMKEGRFCEKAVWLERGGKYRVRCTVFGPDVPLRLFNDAICWECPYHPQPIQRVNRRYPFDFIARLIGSNMAMLGEGAENEMDTSVAVGHLDMTLEPTKDLLRSALIVAARKGLPVDTVTAIAEKKGLLDGP